MLPELSRRIREAITRARSDEEGQGMVEYAMILVFIAVLVILVLAFIGHQVNNVFSNVSTGLGT
ncbi:MAG TPA: Flp family type IVb pilin [Candidatus Dormibacteraeota bacterium]|jgi:pilus assembly protein Flp/PilA|nr:Flp family type IVb pilin [Candidatus Dormibacteraeota bacterium]